MDPLDGLTDRQLAATLLGTAVGSLLVVVGYWSLFGFGAGSGVCACASQPAFAFEQGETAENGSVVITHEGGEVVPAENLVVSVAGRERTWAARANVSGRVRPGDSLTVEATPGERIELVWESDDGESAARVAVYTVASSADSRRRPAPPRR